MSTSSLFFGAYGEIMAKFARFLKLYWTDLVDTSGKIIVDPVRVEFFQGPRSYEVFARNTPPVVRSGVERVLASRQTLSVPADRTYIELIARTTESFGRRQYCENEIDRVVAQLAALLSPNMFVQEVWSGWLSDSAQFNGDLWLMLEPVTSFELKELQQQMAHFSDGIGSHTDGHRLFTLMAKLFARATAMEPGEERFLWLWTVLEVFPMRDTSNVQAISEYLSHITGHAAVDLKGKLEIGQMFGARSRLVHDGKLPYDQKEFASVLKRLEALVVTVLRSIGNLPYVGQLDEYSAARNSLDHMGE